jgi:predicted PurR-regulated permease PerM
MPNSDKEKPFFKTESPEFFFLAGIFIIILIFALYFAREIAVPFVIALIFKFFLTPSVKFLQRFHIPPQVSSFFIILFLVVIIAACFYGLFQPASTWLSKGPVAISNANQKLPALIRPFTTPVFKDISKIGEEISSSQNPEVNTQNVTSDKEALVIGTVAVTWRLFIGFSVTVILLYFLLGYDNYFVRKIVHWSTSFERKREVVVIAHEIQTQIFKFLFARTAINIGLAIAVSLLMWILRMPNPILWGAMTGLLEYIPYLGALISFIIIGIVALFSFGVGYAFLVVFLFFVLVSIEANLVSPIVIGRALTLNPIVIFLSLMLFTWMWGIAGTFVAVPIMVTIKIIAETL